MSAYWKPLAAVLVLLTMVMFVGLRWHRSFQGSAPAFMNVRELSSPAFWTDGQVRRSWPRIQQILKQANAETNAMHVALRSLVYVDVTANGQDALVWGTEEIVNPGFAPLERAETRIGGKGKQFVGYYTLEGKPLRYLLKQDPHEPAANLAAIMLEQPLPPGQTSLVFGVQHQPQRVTTTKAGQQRVGFGPLPPATQGIQARGVGLADGVTVSEYQPSDGAFQGRVDGALTFWFNSTLPDQSPPLSITFQPKP